MTSPDRAQERGYFHCSCGFLTHERRVFDEHQANYPPLGAPSPDGSQELQGRLNLQASLAAEQKVRADTAEARLQEALEELETIAHLDPRAMPDDLASRAWGRVGKVAVEHARSTLARLRPEGANARR